MLNAVQNVNDFLGPKLVGIDVRYNITYSLLLYYFLGFCMSFCAICCDSLGDKFGCFFYVDQILVLSISSPRIYSDNYISRREVDLYLSVCRFWVCQLSGNWKAVDNFLPLKCFCLFPLTYAFEYMGP